MTREQREKQYRKQRKETEAINDLMDEYTQNKIQKAIDMVKRAIREGIRFDYLLTDSWFTCTDMVRFIKFAEGEAEGHDKEHGNQPVIKVYPTISHQRIPFNSIVPAGQTK